MLVGMFEQLWGTTAGANLQAWCADQGWPLAWAYNPAVSSIECGPFGTYPGCDIPYNFTAGRDVVNVRVLDLVVLQSVPAGRNMTLPAADVTYFKDQWVATNVSAISHGKINFAWSEIAERLRPTAAVEPLFAGACANPECVGVSIETRNCVC